MELNQLKPRKALNKDFLKVKANHTDAKDRKDLVIHNFESASSSVGVSQKTN